MRQRYQGKPSRESNDRNYGYNALSDGYENLVKSGVIDPTKVTHTAPQNAASIAGLLLTTECACDAGAVSRRISAVHQRRDRRRGRPPLSAPPPSLNYPDFRYDIVGRSGQLLGVVNLGKSERIVSVSRSAVYVARKDADDIERLRCHPLVL